MSRHITVSVVAILSLSATSAYAQDTTPETPQTATETEKETAEFIKARYHPSGNVSPNEQQRILEEADRIRAYRATQQAQAQTTPTAQPYIYAGAQRGPKLLNGTSVQYQTQTVPAQTYQPQIYRPQPYQQQVGDQIQGPYIRRPQMHPRWLRLMRKFPFRHLNRPTRNNLFISLHLRNRFWGSQPMVNQSMCNHLRLR